MDRKDLSIALDVSLSMGERYSDMVPSKLEASKEVIAAFSMRAIERGHRVALAIFYDRAAPVLPLSSDHRAVVKALSEIDFTEEGSALGDGVVEAVKMLRGSKREKVVIAVTDGGVTGGVPLRAAALYAMHSGSKLILAILNREAPEELRDELERSREVGASVYMIEGKQSLLSLLFSLI